MWEESMTAMTTRILTAAALITALVVSSAQAQPQTVAVSGTISGVDGSVIVVKQRDGSEAKVTLPDNVAVSGVVKKSITDIKPGDFLGVGAIPQPDGSQRAVRVSIFAEAQRGTNEGHYPWTGAPQGTMTNATVGTSVTSVDGQVLMMKYKDGEKKIVVTPETQITTNVPGDKSELKPGANIRIAAATKKPDGSFEASRISVGRDGVVPQ
jgi:hypothetical protein